MTETGKLRSSPPQPFPSQSCTATSASTSDVQASEFLKLHVRRRNASRSATGTSCRSSRHGEDQLRCTTPSRGQHRACRAQQAAWKTSTDHVDIGSNFTLAHQTTNLTAQSLRFPCCHSQASTQQLHSDTAFPTLTPQSLVQISADVVARALNNAHCIIPSAFIQTH